VTPLNSLQAAAGRLAAAQQSAQVTDWSGRVGWIVGLLLVIALVYWLMHEGWKWRGTLQSDLPELPAAPAGPTAAKLSMTGRYHGSTTAGQWLDRIVAHGLGARSRAEVTLTDTGLDVVRPGSTDFFIPAAQLRGARLAKGIAGKVLTEGGMLIVTWQHGDRLIDSGFRSDHAAEQAAWVEAINSTDSMNHPVTKEGHRTMTISTRGAARIPAVLVLEDGRSFRGRAYGAVGETFGEAVFNTGMTGYQETLTDPSYHRQVVVMTAPHVGNTGVNDEDDESKKVWVAGYVVRDPARIPSNWRSRRSLDEQLVRQGIVGISGIDTRALTRHLRERGAMRVGIFSGNASADEGMLLAKVRQAPEMNGADLSAEVTTTETYVVPAIGAKRFTVAALDLGIKGMTPHRLAERGIEVHVLPANATADDVYAVSPDGVFLSNGPGDPATADLTVIKAVLDRSTPLFGICFGNQLLGRSLGFGTYKLKYGHRGINQPVQDRSTGKVEITAHNHGFAVDAPLDRVSDTPYGRAEVSHVCLNDNVVEGLQLLDRPGFSVQYHPEAAAGPHDAAYLFDRFVSLMEGQRA
jgi:carbamoyl-phosphate synthase small subunit